MNDQSKTINFGQEILTQELVTFEKVHVNVSQSLIITTEDRIHLWLQGVMRRSMKQVAWINPLSLLIAVTLTLTTTSFKRFILPAETWYAIFVIINIASLIWFLRTLLYLGKPVVLSEEISKLKTFSPTETIKKRER